MRNLFRSFRRKVRMNRVTLTMAITAFYRYRISKEFYKQDVVRRATNIVNESGVAVVALYPRGPLLNSATRLMRALIDANYHVVAVVNQSKDSPEWIASLSKLNATLIRRPNVGRDFGAYKIGYMFAVKQGLIDAAKHLVFANDSVYYGPRSEEFVKELLQERHPFVGMFVNHDFHTHAQSFFLRYESRVFADQRFEKFWHRFYPAESRRHNIQNGELALSALLTGMGYKPYSFVGPDRVLKSERFGSFTDVEKHLLRVFAGRVSMSEVSLEAESLEQIMRKQYAEGKGSRNITHAQGILVSRVLGAPLKLDLDPRWTPQEALRDTFIAMGCSIDEAHEVLEYILEWSVVKPTR
jgi:hypothetical protein